MEVKVLVGKSPRGGGGSFKETFHVVGFEPLIFHLEGEYSATCPKVCFLLSLEIVRQKWVITN